MKWARNRYFIVGASVMAMKAKRSLSGHIAAPSLIFLLTTTFLQQICLKERMSIQ